MVKVDKNSDLLEGVELRLFVFEREIDEVLHRWRKWWQEGKKKREEGKVVVEEGFEDIERMKLMRKRFHS